MVTSTINYNVLFKFTYLEIQTKFLYKYNLQKELKILDVTHVTNVVLQILIIKNICDNITVVITAKPTPVT